MDDHLLQHDAAHRLRALEPRSFICEAPAGAGKTELLTQRYLKLLASVDEPEEIVAITFTNKAAGEMRERIAGALERARSGQMPPEPHKRVTFELAQAALARDAACGWGLAAQPGRLRLTTIDALCASLARQLPYLSRFGAQPAVMEDARPAYLEAARRTLARLEDETVGEVVALALAHLDNDASRLAGLLAAMLARREQWAELRAMAHPESAIAASLAALVKDELSRVAAGLPARWQQTVMPLARFAAANLGPDSVLAPLAEWTAPLSTDTDLPCWRALSQLLLTGEGEVRKAKGITRNQGFPADDKPRKAALIEVLEALTPGEAAALRRIRELPDLSADRESEVLVRALVGLLQLAAVELWGVFRERGEVDFSELSTRAIAALGEEGMPSELALKLDYRIRHLLVDEFQDTSPTQTALLQQLTAGWQPDDGRTLFLVGDPMQSIYRFRKADVGLFLRTAADGIGGLALERLRLERNNRSDPAVVAWINAQFPAVFPPADAAPAGEIRYRPFVATRAAVADAGVAFHPVLVDTDVDKAEVLDAEAHAVVALIAAEWRADPQRQIAVLVRAREHLQPLIAAIRRTHADWRYAAVEVEPLAARQVVQDLLVLTHALHHRADRLHWLALLRAPWCGLRLADLHALAADDHEATIWALINDTTRASRLSPDGALRLAHVRGVLAEALAGQGRQRRRRWVEDVWRKLGGPACADAAGLADAAAFFERLDKIDTAGRFALDMLDDDMAALYAPADALADGRLQLMTVHKSKGLEFDTVILPGLARTLPNNDAPLLAWDSFALRGGETLVCAPLNQRRRADRNSAPTAYDFLQGMERARSRNEEARVLYVAATRAIRRLHLVGVVCRDVADDKSGAIKAPRATSPLARLWPALGGLAAEAAQVGAGRTALNDSATNVMPGDIPVGLADFVPPLLRLRAPSVPPTWHAPAVAGGAFVVDETTAEPLAAAVGTLVHACLEQIAGRVDAWPAARVASMHAACERWLRSRGWSGDDAVSGATRAVSLLATTLTSRDGRWLLAKHADAAAELALAQAQTLDDGGAGGMAESAVVRVIDRCFVADGTRWIVDYKTADLGPAADAASLQAHAERYRPQLDGYARLFDDAGMPVRRAVFYVAYGTLIRLD